MKNSCCLNRSWTDETNSCQMEAGSMEMILTKEEAGRMKNNNATTGE
jgi:hypothetical protein